MFPHNACCILTLYSIVDVIIQMVLIQPIECGNLVVYTHFMFIVCFLSFKILSLCRFCFPVKLKSVLNNLF